jgi:hypothetical protein
MLPLLSLYPDHALQKIKVMLISSFHIFVRLFIQLPVPLRRCTPKTGLDRTGPRLDHGLGPAAVRSYATEKTGPDRTAETLLSRDKRYIAKCNGEVFSKSTQIV